MSFLCVPAAHRQHRTGRRADDPFCHRTQDEPAPARRAVGRDDDQIDVLFLGDLDDPIVQEVVAELDDPMLLIWASLFHDVGKGLPGDHCRTGADRVPGIARAVGLGSACIAIADDAASASWSPGGLVQLEKPAVSAVGAVFQRIEDFSGVIQIDAGRLAEQTGNTMTVNIVMLGALAASGTLPISFSVIEAAVKTAKTFGDVI